MVKNQPASAGGTGLVPGQGRSHMLWDNKPVSDNHEACALESGLHSKRSHHSEKPSRSSGDPAQPKYRRYIKETLKEIYISRIHLYFHIETHTYIHTYRRAAAVTDGAEAQPRGATPRPRSGAEAALCWSSREEIPPSKVRETQVRWQALREGVREQTH